MPGQLARPVEHVELAVVVGVPWSGGGLCSERSAGRGGRAKTVRAVSAVALVGAVALLLGGEWLLSAMSPAQCSYLRQTGRPCLGCGGTRAYGLLVKGQIGAAARTNLLGAFTGAAVWLLALGAAGSLATGSARILKACVVLVVLVTPLVMVGGVVIWWRASSQCVL
jgi:hypothetical protein